MKKNLLIILFSFGVLFTASAQQFVWKAGVHSFFDNTEFSGSDVQNSQTMSGVHLSPEIGLSWNKKHRIFVGFDLMHEFGNNEKIVDYADPLAYYNFDGERFRFYMGAFPRTLALSNYPRMFFQDSIANYRPVLNGLFWEYCKKDNYANVWLDWTSRQTELEREAFFMGWSGRYNLGVFYGQHFGYMYHFAHRKNMDNPGNLHDNGLILTSLGVDFSSKTAFEKLEANLGWSVALERNRDGDNEWDTPQGLLSEVKIEYKGLGLFNTLYLGQGQQIYYETYGNALYWGDRFYRTKQYNRTDLYVNFFKTNVVNVKLIVTFHFAEKANYSQQALYASFDLDNLQKKEPPKYDYIWTNWFKCANF